MNKLLAAGSRYLKEMDLTDIALLKICMTALGVLVGLCAAKHHKKGMGILAGLALVATWIPVMAKFFAVFTASED